MSKKHKLLRGLLMDILAAGLALMAFALFHHVLPREQQSLNVQIANPAAAVTVTAAETEKETGEEEPPAK